MTPPGMPGPGVVLGVAGGIAAYKACEVLRGLTESGCDVTVVPTAAALRFVGAATWSALSGKPVATDVWQDAHRVPHVRLGQEADCIVVAPATADLLARATHGIADDLLTNVLLTARCPVVLAPAMHTEMWEHPATRRNVALLRERGVIVLDPAERAAHRRGHRPGPAARAGGDRRGRPATSCAGGRPAAPPTSPAGASSISSGGTREPWDPVRFLGNRSSGSQGVELARTAITRGARRSRWWRRTWTWSRRPAPIVVRVGTAEELRGGDAGRGRRRRRGGHGRRRRRLPARRAGGAQAQARRDRPDPSPAAGAEPRHPARARRRPG